MFGSKKPPSYNLKKGGRSTVGASTTGAPATVAKANTQAGPAAGAKPPPATVETKTTLKADQEPAENAAASIAKRPKVEFLLAKYCGTISSDSNMQRMATKSEENRKVITIGGVPRVAAKPRGRNSTIKSFIEVPQNHQLKRALDQAEPPVSKHRKLSSDKALGKSGNPLGQDPPLKSHSEVPRKSRKRASEEAEADATKRRKLSDEDNFAKNTHGDQVAASLSPSASEKPSTPSAPMETPEKDSSSCETLEKDLSACETSKSESTPASSVRALSESNASTRTSSGTRKAVANEGSSAGNEIEPETEVSKQSVPALPCGLHNPMNACYMSGPLQFLHRTLNVAEFKAQVDKTTLKTEPQLSITDELIKLLEDMRTPPPPHSGEEPPYKVIEPAQFKKAFGRKHQADSVGRLTKRFDGNSQQDFAEFFRLLMCDLQASCKDSSFLKERFQAKTKKLRTCTECDRTSVREEERTNEWFLSMRLQIQDDVKAFIAEGGVDTIEFRCETCKKSTKHESVEQLSTFPPHLAVKIERLTQDWKNGGPITKNKSQVILPEGIVAIDRADSRKPVKYRMTGLSNHKGKATAGHYTSWWVAREDNQDSWLFCNDDDLTFLHIDTDVQKKEPPKKKPLPQKKGKGKGKGKSKAKLTKDRCEEEELDRTTLGSDIVMVFFERVMG